MNNPMLCGYRDDMRLWDEAETAAERHDKALESHTEYLVEECKSLDYVTQLEFDYELSETGLMEKLIQAVAEWSGRSDGKNGAAEQIRKLHNILFAQLKKTVAESEVG